MLTLTCSSRCRLLLPFVLFPLFFINSCKLMTPRFFPFDIELNTVDLGQYDPGTDSWFENNPLPAGHGDVIFTYTLRNRVPTWPGKVTGRLVNVTTIPLQSSPQFPNTVPIIAAGDNFLSTFHCPAPPEGKYKLYFTYTSKGTSRVFTPSGQWEYLDTVLAEVVLDYIVPPDMTDNDQDGIPDGEEKKLLARFSPSYRFSTNNGHDEDYPPADVMEYIRQSRLITSTDEDHAPVEVSNALLASNPLNLLFAIPTAVHPTATSVITHAAITTFHIDPTDAAAQGSSWADCMAARNIGLYGHVVPYVQADPQINLRDNHLVPNKRYYKIEYWQFFGYNATGFRKFTDHEGDWTTVELLYSPADDSVVTVFHYAHGWEFRFDLNSAKDTTFPEPSVMQITGDNARFNPDLRIASLDDNFSIVQNEDFVKAQNNIVRFERDPLTLKFTHPVVYLENGAHEFYPSPFWKFIGAPDHNGNSIHNYICATPPNLGEVEHPLMEYPGAPIILQFNGCWGAFSSQHNEPGPGPAFHQQWTWPSSSSIGWLLKGLPIQ